MLQKGPSEANPKVRNHGEGPSRGLVHDCENFADGSFAALALRGQLP